MGTKAFGQATGAGYPGARPFLSLLHNCRRHVPGTLRARPEPLTSIHRLPVESISPGYFFPDQTSVKNDLQSPLSLSG